ncbi:protein RIK [Citrus sinensis]|uniref:Protein RIK n=1 Tax=Citrus sinensis TaxID=2711 RepID=A0ACB8K6M0_CITSI|nr:protein RIK [Citrus sinensis]
MTEDSHHTFSSDDSAISTDGSSQTRQRKKRKWDQPAESLINFPLASFGISLPGVPVAPVVPAPAAAAFFTNPPVASGATVPPVVLQGPLPPKFNQPKVQDELIIAREIVINDSESSVRYKLTKRHTQEEIQKCTGAVVITRGKYRLPNAPPDGEKPLYLHISAGAHLKETAERILAVDHAAAMVEEMLKQGHAGFPTLQTAMGNGVQAMSTSVFLGFDADASLNIAARIRGPNLSLTSPYNWERLFFCWCFRLYMQDQYINHIMNETGATVLLRGRGSGNSEGLQGEEVHQPLHLFLSSNNPKSLEEAKRLAENLLDTISAECGASRVSSCKVYNAVPPPQQLLTGIQGFGNEQKLNAGSAAILTSTVNLSSVPLAPSVPGVTTVYSQGMMLPSGGILNSVQPQQNIVGYPQPVSTGGTSYSGYEGIYPQATPLQQVALALRQSSSPLTSLVTPTASVSSTATTSTTSTAMSEKEKRPPQKRKFQELPVGSKGPAKHNQGSEISNRSELSANLDVRNVSNMPPPSKLVQPIDNGMPHPPPRNMPPPPPPKFTLLAPTAKLHDKNNSLNKTKSDNIPVVSDTLVKLMEYGEDDDD